MITEKHLLIVQVHSSSSPKVLNSQYTNYTSCTWGYISTEVNHTIYICRGITSAVYFKHKSKTFNIESVNKLEKPETEKAKIHKHNNRKVKHDMYK